MKAFRITKEIELIIASAGALQGFFLTVVSLTKKRGADTLLLAIIFFSISIRIVKSLLWVYVDNLHIGLINMGFLAHSVFGPALFLYFYYRLFSKNWNPLHAFHFLPSLLLLIAFPYISLKSFWYIGGYSALLYLQAGYTCASIYLVVRKLRDTRSSLSQSKEDRQWLILLLTGAGLLQLAYFSNYIIGATPYLLGPLVYAIFIFVISFYAFSKPQVLQPRTWSTPAKTDPDEIKQIKDALITYMEAEEPYLSPSCSLKGLAENIKVHPYQLSHVVNSEFLQNFSSFINRYRIARAKTLLMDCEYEKLKISSIAFEVGFNSLSSFNAAFKKDCGMTPSEFRERHSDS